MEKLFWVRIPIGVCLCAYFVAACSQTARPTSTRKPTPTVLLTVAPTIKLTNSLQPSTAPSPTPVLLLTPIPSATPSHTPMPSVTPQPSATHTRTITPAETPVVLVFTATAANLPVITHDLQFIQDNRVMVWNHNTGQIEVKLDMKPWLEGVDAPRIYYSNNKLIRISGMGQSEQREGPVNIDLIDATTRKVQLLDHHEIVSGKNMVSDFSVSPLLNWMTYMTADWSEGSDPPLSNIILHAIHLDAPYQQFKVSDYVWTSQGTGTGIWSPNEDNLIWEDARGIWISNLSKQTTRLLIAQEAGTAGSVSPQSAWSSSGRYLLAEVAGGIEGGSMAVLDTQTGRMETIAGTFEYIVPGAKPGWIKDDRLFVVYPGDWLEGKYPLMGRIWSLNPDSESMFSLELEFPIDNVDASFSPYAPTQLDDGRLGFAIAISSSESWEMPPAPKDRWDSGLYIVNLEELKPQRVNILPKEYYSQVINWLPDGSGALVQFWSETRPVSLFYIPSDGSPLWDLTSLLGEGACFFEWLP